MKIVTEFPKLFIRQKTNGMTLDVLNLEKFSLTKIWPINNVDFCKRKWTFMAENITTLEYVRSSFPTATISCLIQKKISSLELVDLDRM